MWTMKFLPMQCKQSNASSSQILTWNIGYAYYHFLFSTFNLLDMGIIDVTLKVRCDQYTEVPYQLGSLHDLTEQNYSNM